MLGQQIPSHTINLHTAIVTSIQVLSRSLPEVPGYFPAEPHHRTPQLGNPIPPQPPSSASTPCTRKRHAIRVPIRFFMLNHARLPEALQNSSFQTLVQVHITCISVGTLLFTVSRARAHVSMCHRRAVWVLKT
ncbi:hypothetical protein BU25DRAFT_66079 [Macroventuria anomochaeta]|uniref:Uncharacterized protein n=1 Tax=Macroventuria anomochaeta TaxID=301207 RepID=A0ACB6RZT0_9PLEO|nr:uncharacterized protein BU25DRAFT_66079 [Macroventuria anomochaeta]KAF2627480.1 hypothetical protein BU25DRAFT_66079 [Macroventuria anomochaeta]